MSSSTWQQEWPEQAVLSQPPVPSAKGQSSWNQRGGRGPIPPGETLSCQLPLLLEVRRPPRRVRLRCPPGQLTKQTGLGGNGPALGTSKSLLVFHL